MMKILIVGEAKTGTTGLFYKIRNSIGGTVRIIFEGERFTPRPDDSRYPVLAKVLIDSPNPDIESFSSFEKKILIVRDPRDTLVSRTLYTIGYHAPYESDEERVRAMIDVLSEKERCPSRVSLLRILCRHNDLSGQDSSADAVREQERQRLRRIRSFTNQNQNFFTIRYEDFVAEQLSPLEAYLGFALAGPASVDPAFSRVVRTAASGDWLNWFTAEDVEFFRPIHQPFLVENSYALDWTIPESPVIRPEHASKYVIRILNEKRKLLGLSEFATK